MNYAKKRKLLQAGLERGRKASQELEPLNKQELKEKQGRELLAAHAASKQGEVDSERQKKDEDENKARQKGEWKLQIKKYSELAKKTEKQLKDAKAKVKKANKNQATKLKQKIENLEQTLADAKGKVELNESKLELGG